MPLLTADAQYPLQSLDLIGLDFYFRSWAQVVDGSGEELTRRDLMSGAIHSAPPVRAVA